MARDSTDHYELAMEIAELASTHTGGDARGAVIASLARSLNDLVSVCSISEEVPRADGDQTLGVLRFDTHKFFSINLGNIDRDWSATATAASGLVAGGLGAADWLLLDAAPHWPGLGALAVIVLAAIGRGKALIAQLSIDDACTLDLAWRASSNISGFRIVRIADIAPLIGDVAAIYGNHGFNEAKLLTSIGRLKALGMVVEAGGTDLQLVEAIRVSGTRSITITP